MKETRRDLALMIPNFVISRPYETFMAVIGIVSSIPVLLRLDNSEHVYKNFPLWVTFTWAALMILGGLRTSYGLAKENRREVSAGSTMVAWMSEVYGVSFIYFTGGDGGWVFTLAGLAMIVISSARSLHLMALKQAIDRVKGY